eukprot:4093195-Pyramimonas_sp.AAC.1
MQQHFCQVERGHRLTLPDMISEYNDLPSIVAADSASLDYIPTIFDLQHQMRSYRRGKAPGVDGLPSCVYKVAPRELARILNPLMVKIVATGREPFLFKVGEAAYFFKGSGVSTVAKNMRNILLASTVCKLHHKHIRSLSQDFLATALLAEQCGGVGGRSTEMITLSVRTFLRHCSHTRTSGAVICLDLVQAFYTTIKQFALSLPGEDQRLEEALASLPLPEVLIQGAKAQLQQGPLLHRHFPQDELI